MKADVTVLVESEYVPLQRVKILLVISLLLVQLLLVFVLFAVNLIDTLLHEFIGIFRLTEGLPTIINLDWI